MNHSYPYPDTFDSLLPQTHTVILLHPRGSHGRILAHTIIDSCTSEGHNLSYTFPTVKFIFPTAKKRPATSFGGITIRQWFDYHSLEEIRVREYLQFEGLIETTHFVHDLIRREVEDGIDIGNIVLGGVGQGCAASLYALLAFDGRLGGYVGISGWFPFVAYLQDVLQEGENEKWRVIDSLNLIRGYIDFLPLQYDVDEIPVLRTPVFICHGEEDDRVDVSLGKEIVDVLRRLSMDVTWKTYVNSRYWFKASDEMKDFVDFLKTKVETLRDAETFVELLY
ncbi:hypothetical protein TWF694_005513 [Orbilia ellipsospora]|uniref:Phospholipase/carboxylesterase/thioesterase domain-containing protein n=1 Tax=Orbilia ellipsospora TaxID=2528407 RepID=A0AAV9WTB3_9PEZI